MSDPVYMHRCLELAERGLGRVGTNPLVGALLVRGGEVIAEAWHEGFGRAHAERALLEHFPGKILPTDTFYVNLEPCCHVGKTPPCTDIMVERGVKRVIFGMVDPDPQVAGKGISALRRAQVEVIGPVERARCEWFNRGFISLRTRGRPWVTLRSARTKSGAIAKPDGSPLKITSEEQDRWVHAWLRARHDGILVGVQTVVSDNPLLNTRFVQKLPSPLRVILDPHLRIPITAKVVTGEMASGTLVVTGEGSDVRERQVLEARGARVLPIPLQDGRFVFGDLWEALTTPSGGFPGIASLLIEGGERTWRFFREAGVVDEEVILVGRS